jgi:hexosaminidase
MSWRGDKGAVEAANQNHDVVLAPAPTLYLDSVQSRRADESAGRLFVVTLADLYAYDPFPKGLAPTRAGIFWARKSRRFPNISPRRAGCSM